MRLSQQIWRSSNENEMSNHPLQSKTQIIQNSKKDNMNHITTLTPEMETLKTKLQATWSSGDFGQIAKSYAPGAAEFVNRLNLQPGERVLDVATGTGNLAIPTARSGAVVTGQDISANLLEQGQLWAKKEGLNIKFDQNDAEAMPYEDGAFDTVITMFGAMFTPRP
jgi:2-polyprenyl-3-methyl-5-hydroxy-6-metoxy-1,4-benzoquinol methylase